MTKPYRLTIHEYQRSGDYNGYVEEFATEEEARAAFASYLRKYGRGGIRAWINSTELTKRGA